MLAVERLVANTALCAIPLCLHAVAFVILQQLRFKQLHRITRRCLRFAMDRPVPASLDATVEELNVAAQLDFGQLSDMVHSFMAGVDESLAAPVGFLGEAVDHAAPVFAPVDPRSNSETEAPSSQAGDSPVDIPVNAEAAIT